MSRNFPEISHSLLPLFDILLLFNWTIVVSLAIALPKGSQFGSGGLGYVSRYFSGGWKTEHPATWGASTKCNIDRRVRHFDIVLDYHFSHIAQPSTTARAVLHGPFDAHAYRMLMGACNLMVCTIHGVQANLTVAEFEEEYVNRNLPVIITGVRGTSTLFWTISHAFSARYRPTHAV